MGYRSDVIVGIPQGMSAQVQAMKVGKDETFGQIFTLDYVEDGTEVWFVSDVKWYGDNKELNDFIAFINTLGPQDGFILVIGEENESDGSVGHWWKYIKDITIDN